MFKKFFCAVLACILFGATPISAADLLKPSPEEALKLQKLDPQAMAYQVRYMWQAGGYRYALVKRVAKFDLLHKADGKTDVLGSLAGEPFIILMPNSFPRDNAKFSGFIKDKDGKVATFHPVTKEVIPYE